MKKFINILGMFIALLYFIQMAASYWLAPAEVEFETGSLAAEFYARMTGILVPDFLMRHEVFLGIYCTPLLLNTLLCAFMLIRIGREQVFDPSLPRRLYSWAIVFALVSAPGLPVQAQDLWASVAWGKMAAGGYNPYYHEISDAIAAVWYPDNLRSSLTYGPLWAILIWLVALLIHSQWLTFVVMKFLVFAFWLASLTIVDKIMRERTIRERCLALVLAGWLPLVIGQTVGEGHNDIAMMTFVLLWLASRNAVALSAAILFKYLVAPLAVFPLLERRRPLELVAAAALGIGFFALFYRGSGFFDGNLLMLDWKFLTPRQALGFLGPAAPIAVLPFLAIAALQFWRYWRERSDVARLKAVIAVLALVLFGGLSLIWPWYPLQVLLPAALLPLWPFSVWIVGVALAAPFSALYIFRDIELDPAWPALIFYGVAFGWMAIWAITVPRRPHASIGRAEG